MTPQGIATAAAVAKSSVRVLTALLSDHNDDEEDCDKTPGDHLVNNHINNAPSAR